MNRIRAANVRLSALGESFADIGAIPSVNKVGDFFADSVAQLMKGHCGAALVRAPELLRPRKTTEELDLATLGWVAGLASTAFIFSSEMFEQWNSRKSFREKTVRQKDWPKKQL